MRSTIIVIDKDSLRKAAVARALGQDAYVIPVDSLDEIAPQWPGDAMVIVSNSGGCVEETLARLDREGRAYPLILLGDVADGGRMAELMLRGFVGLLDWPAGAEQLRQQLATYSPIVERRILAHRIESRARSLIASLSDRETQVLAGISEGLSNKEIAKDLSISPRTVEIHRSNAITKLRAGNSHGATRIYFEATYLGLLTNRGVPGDADRGMKWEVAA